MIPAFVRWCIAHRRFVVALTFALAILGLAVGLPKLKLDALPEITGNQVIVLTQADGLTPEEIELRVTRPVEAALSGLAGVVGQRSLSRYGISSITVIFDDDVDPYRARQVVSERLASLDDTLPDGVGHPEVAPMVGGLGDVYHFALSSPELSLEQLYQLATVRLAPLLLAVPGVVEVNTWGGAIGTFDVVADPTALARHGLTLSELAEALGAATGSVAGAVLPAGDGQTLLRGVAFPTQPEELGALVVRSEAQGAARPILLSELATIQWGRRPRIGAATINGQGEGIYVLVQMLSGSNALEVLRGIHEVLPQLRQVLPESVTLSPTYDRSILVKQTVRTVGLNLLEGGLLVLGILLALLGSVRAGLLTALVIPLAMVGALVGMGLLGVPGNLMSLGALDFGLLVDGAVVMVEAAFLQLHRHRERSEAAREEAVVAQITQAAVEVARPVFFSVLVLLLVYVPVLSLTGVDGKMFRPMALTLVLALSCALVLSLSFVPAAVALWVRPQHLPKKTPLLVRLSAHLYRPSLDLALRRPAPVLLGAAGLLAFGAWLFTQLGTAFIPQLDEGDLVIQTAREPDISLEAAVAKASALERLILETPEVRQVVTCVGSPAVAIDIMGIEESDIYVALKPRSAWRPGLTREALIAELNARVDAFDPGADAAFTQPIQMRFNELLAGAVADVVLSYYGEDLQQLRALAEASVEALEGLEGAEDVLVLAPPAVSLTQVRPDPVRAARYGFRPAEVLSAVQAVQAGVEVGYTYDQALRIPIRLRVASTVMAGTLGDLRLPSPAGPLVRLDEIAQIEEGYTPALVDHEGGQRRILVGFNVRGRDLGPVVADAQARVAAAVALPEGYRRQWGGQSQTLEEATARLLQVIPLVLVGILFFLVLTFRKLWAALVVFLNVPFASVGGLFALWAREMPLSISAAVGLIALSGIAVLNGVVLMSRILHNLQTHGGVREAVREAALSRLRPVLMTALVAAFGFVPMMLATGIGAEVQRPLATVVVGGLVSSTLLTLGVLPGLVVWLRRDRSADLDVTPSAPAA